MSVFYSTLIQNNHILLEAEEAIHCSKVLRKQLNDIVEVIDGKGGFYKAQITGIEKNSVSLKITESLKVNPQTLAFHLCFAPTKSNDRTEWLLEKACEMGVSEITLLNCARSERIKINEERWNKILLSACKQSKNAWIPKLNGIKKFEKFIDEENPSEKKFIAYCGDEIKKEVSELKGKSICVLIGPEGDFTEDEVRNSKLKGFEVLSLGESRMRVETAGLFVIAAAKTNALNK